MKCSDAENMILLADSGELAANKETLLKAHLLECEACSTFQNLLQESRNLLSPVAEPPEKVLQTIKREARIRAPEHRHIGLPYWKPALASAASLLIGLSLFFTQVRPGAVGLELVVTEKQMLDTTDQVSSVLYSGLSEDDLAFNFLMTYEVDAEG